MLIWILDLDQPANGRSIPEDGYNSAPREMAPPLPARTPPIRISNNQEYDQVQHQEYDPVQHQGYGQVQHQEYQVQHQEYDQVQYQSYPDSTTYRGAGGYRGNREVTHHYDGDEEGEAVGGFQGEGGQGMGEEEVGEAQEQVPEPEDEQEEGYPWTGGEPVENEEGQGYNNYRGYGAGVEEGEGEYDGGYGYQASRRW